MLRQRLLSGLVLVLITILIFYLDSAAGRAGWPGLVLLAVLLGILPLAGMELLGLLRAIGIRAPGVTVVLGAQAVAIAMYIAPERLPATSAMAWVATVLAGCFAATLGVHCRGGRVDGAVAAAGAGMLVAVYLGLLGGVFLIMRLEHSAWVVLAVVLITKAADTGAYFTGRAVGRHKLIPWLSPKKTWEGLAGGIILACLIGMLLAWAGRSWPALTTIYRPWAEGQMLAVTPHYSIIGAAVLGAALALVGLAGDLTMSLFKRDAGLKDSGTMLPGMGGWLDVLDSLLLVGPVAYWLLKFMAEG